MSLSLRFFFLQTQAPVADLKGDALKSRLREAVIANRSREVHALLDGGLAVDSPLSAIETPLTLALLNHHWVLAQELLDRGANPDQKVNAYLTCLGWAGMSQQPGLVAKLLERTTWIKKKDYNGYTPLTWAVRFGVEEAVDRLIANGARLDVEDQGGDSLLHVAALGADPSIVRKLLKANPALVKSVSVGRKQTPLHIAASNLSRGAVEVIQTLMAAGLAPDQEDYWGQTPVMLAAGSNSAAVFEALLSTGAEFSQSDRARALKLAIAGDRRENVIRLMAGYDLSRPLDESHPLRSAILCRRWSLAEMLLRSGVSPDSRLPDGEALLPWSMKQFLPELTRTLLQAGATIGREQAVEWLNNVMLLRKVCKVALGPGSRPETQPLEGRLVVALQKNIETLGFMLSPQLAERVLTLSLDELRAFHDQLISCLRVMVGAQVAYKPMYPNFPDQVKEASAAELYLNAALHYWGDLIGRRIMPGYDKKTRPPLGDTPSLKMVGLADPQEVNQLFRRLLEARGALIPDDKENLSWIVYSRGDVVISDLPEEVPFRENSALLAAALLRFTGLHERARCYVKTGIDVLRAASAYSGGDVSLAANTRFVRFSKPLRRWFLAVLEADANLDESLWRQPEKFKRLGERLHPGEHAKRFPKAYEAFRKLRSADKPSTFASRVEGYLAEAQVQASLALLVTRPGEFARRLDHLLRLGSGEDGESVMRAFAGIASQLPCPLLLQLRKHFQERDKEVRLRVVFPKGDLGKIKAVDNTLPSLDPGLCGRVDQLCRGALIANFAQRAPLGLCWLDERLKSYNVPFAMRSAAKSLHTVARGSRIPFPSGQGQQRETMRFFIWWRDGKSRTDLDLSALVLDGNFVFQTALAYYNLKELGGYHSGDITSAPDGASEFIDIEVPTLLDRGSRYVMMVVSSFTTQPYCDLPECFAGFMHRTHPASGEIYEPRTILNKFDLTANTTIAIPLILDLSQRQVIWTDLSLKRNPSTANNVHGNRSSLSLLCESMVSLRKPSLHDLFELHIEARGQTAPRDDAQTIFSSQPGDGTVTAYDIPLILSDYL